MQPQYFRGRPSATEVVDRVLQQLPNVENRPATRNEASKVCSRYPTLVCEIGRLPRSNGTLTHCLCLNGTVPVLFNGQKYNIPLTIFFEPAFPRLAPRIFVIPPANMYLRPNHPNVGPNGTVGNLAALNAWSPHADLCRIVDEIIVAFGRTPPVAAGTPPPRVAAEIAAQRQRSASFSSHVAGGSTISASSSTNITPARASCQHRYLALMTTEIERLHNELGTVTRGALDANAAASNAERDARVLEDRKVALQGELASVDSNIGRLQDWITEHEDTEMDPDALHNVEDPVGRQMERVVAKANAMEDAMYILYSKGLANQTIELDEFVRAVRQQSRKQFAEAALARHLSGIMKMANQTAHQPTQPQPSHQRSQIMPQMA